jgi:hypothetical protein
MAKKLYQYRPLGPYDLTRVLHLHPAAERDALLRCDLEHRTEKDFFAKAVSYAWGPPLFTGTLLCDGNDNYIPITPSLEALLRSLRDDEDEVILWVDAVCINQHDAAEKSAQVQAMSDIYRRAYEVVAWVGDDYEDGAKVVSFLDKHFMELSTAYHRVVLVDHRYRNVNDYEKGMKALVKVETSLQATFGAGGLEAFRKFFLRPWFQRRWVVQEVVLARNATIRCGSERGHFSTFATGAKTMNLFFDSKEIQPSLGSPFLMEDHVADIINDLGNNYSQMSWKGRTTGGIRFPILGLLKSFHATQCSDDRDRVYALLGLSDDLSPKASADRAHNLKRQKRTRFQMPVNYEHQTEQVYTTLAMELMDSYTYGAVSLLHSAGAFRPADGAVVTLPSWIPDWRAPLRYLPILDSDFSAGPRWQAHRYWKVLEDGKTLELTGWKLGPVAEKVGGPRDSSSPEQLKKIIQHWWKFFASGRQGEGDHSTHSRIPRHAQEIESFFDSVVMRRRTWNSAVYPPDEFVDFLFDRAGHHGGTESTAVAESDGALAATKLGGESCRGDEAGQLPEEQPGEHHYRSAAALRMRDCAKNLAELVKGRSLCRNDEGVLMNCPDDVEIGDVIAVFYNVNTPFVIRAIKKPSITRGQREECFRLIGDCYVEGGMERERGSAPKVSEETRLFRLV